MVLGLDSQSNHWLPGKLEITYPYMVTRKTFHALIMVLSEFFKIADAFIAIRCSVIFIVAQEQIGAIDVPLNS